LRTSFGTVSARRRIVSILIAIGLALPVSAAPVSAAPVPEPPVGADPWLETINWWRSFGGATDGTPLPPLVGSAARNVGPQNFVDYLMHLRSVGSSYCLHWEDPDHPRTPGVDYSHNGLVCMRGRLADGIEAWMRVPYHAGGLSPLLEGVGAAKATNGMHGAMAILYDHFDTLPPSVTNKTFVWPAPGGYMPRRSWGGGEWPDPSTVCPPISDDDTNGQAVMVHWPRTSSGWWPEPQRRFVSLSAVDSAGVVPMCQPLITDFSLRPYGQTAAVAGTVVGDAILFPQRAWAVGPATVTYVTTALDGSDRRTLTWSFEVLAPPAEPTNVRTAWSGNGRYRLLWDAPSGASSTRVAGYEVSFFGAAPESGDSLWRSERVSSATGWFDLEGRWPDVSTWAASGSSSAASASTGIYFGGLVLGDTGLAAGATAVLTNLTIANSDHWTEGYATADKCSRLHEREQDFSNGNLIPYYDVANLSVVELDSDSTFCVYVSDQTSVVLDVQGSFSPSGALGFTPIAPRRVMDTRSTPQPGAGSIVRVETGLVSGESSALVNLTMTQAREEGYVTADKCSALVAGEQSFSNGNFRFWSDAANLAVVPVDPDGSFCIYTSAPVDLVVDLQGSFGPTGRTAFDLVSPRRVLDTRRGVGPTSDSIVRVATGLTAEAALVNITMTNAVDSGYLTADRCSVMRSGEQSKSNGNFSPEVDIANLSVVPLDPDGSFCVYVNADVDVVVDVQGSFSRNGSLRFTPVAPRRIADTRQWSTEPPDTSA